MQAGLEVGLGIGEVLLSELPAKQPWLSLDARLEEKEERRGMARSDVGAGGKNKNADKGSRRG